jgi:dihydrofolate synthase/folylpolyglutamate synthase
MSQAAGYRTGLYTSPHLESVEERIRIDGRVIDRSHLADILDHVVHQGETAVGDSPTYFEALTVAAFVWFAEQKVDLAVVEVGMGGRLDATNLCEPLISIITSISLEHTEHLGPTLKAIAGEKAGILRSGRPALTWIEAPEAAAATRTIAAGLGADLHLVETEVTVERVEALEVGQRITLRTAVDRYSLEIALPGAHQIHNVALAVRAAETLAALGWSGFDATAISRGAAATRWPGRLETVILPIGRRVLLDAAHNPEGAETLADFLTRQPKPVTLLFGALQDKEVAGMLGPLLATGQVGDVVLTSPLSSRARNPEELRASIPAAGRQVLVEPGATTALEKALHLESETILACGSIYLVGAIREELRRRWGVPASATSSLNTGLTARPADAR